MPVHAEDREVAKREGKQRLRFEIGRIAHKDTA